VLSSSLVVAQTNRVSIIITAPDWEVASLADLVDVTTLALKANVASFSITLTPTAQVRTYLEIELLWKLVGDPSPSQLFLSTTKDFFLSSTRVISSTDLERGSTELAPRTTFNTAQETRLKDQFRSIAYAPPGEYILRVTSKEYPTNVVLGTAETRVTVRSTSENMPITILEPLDGSTVQTMNPTVSWSTDARRAKVSFVEARGRSPQEALSDPRQQSTIVEGSTYTFPVNAIFRLEAGKVYYVVVSPLVETPRGTVEAPPAISSFRVMENSVLSLLDNFFATVGGDAAGSYETLKRMGFNPSDLFHNGRPITIDDLRAILNELAQKGALGPGNPSGFNYIFQ
jgi:hypothetical protein